MPKLFVNTFLAIVLLVFFLNGKAQVNLVPNPSFEIYSACPNWAGQTDRALPWFNPNLGSSDYFDTCDVSTVVGVPQNFAGYQYAINSGGYAGIIAYYDSSFIFREYIEVKLISTLQAGTKYFVTFYISLADSSTEAIDQFGAYFSNDTTKSTNSLPLGLIPQIANPNFNYLSDKLSWTKISGTYTATGNENFITIGNFMDSTNTHVTYSPGGSTKFSYYFIDNVCVSTDSLACNSPISIETFKYIDINLSPNPSNESFILEIYSPAFLTLYDNVGDKVIDQKLITGKNIINVADLKNNIYFMEVKNNSQVISRKKIIVQH